MNIMTMPLKIRTAETDKKVAQKKAVAERFWLRVDAQPKSFYPVQVAAEKAGSEIKSKFPVVRVSIYDSEKGETTTL